MHVQQSNPPSTHTGRENYSHESQVSTTLIKHATPEKQSRCGSTIKQLQLKPMKRRECHTYQQAKHQLPPGSKCMLSLTAVQKKKQLPSLSQPPAAQSAGPVSGPETETEQGTAPVNPSVLWNSAAD
ncbi:hypothetical protein Dimus_038078 [Dionaea muscipula]